MIFDIVIVGFEISTLLAIPVLLFYVIGLIKRFLAYVWRKKQSQYYRAQEYVLLRLTVPKEDEKASVKGPIVAEQIFSSLYGSMSSIKILDFLRGKAQPKFSFEIAHVDDNIYFYVYAPKRYQKMVESQIYAHYPDVEMLEVEDYMVSSLEVSEAKDEVGQIQNAELRMQNGLVSADFSVVKSDVSIEQNGKRFEEVDVMQDAVVGEMGMLGIELWPMKTYQHFVDSADKTQVETLAGITSAMSKLNCKGDQAWLQFVIRPRHYHWQKYGWKLFAMFQGGYFTSPYEFMAWFARWYNVPCHLYHVFVLEPLTGVLKFFWKAFGLKKESGFGESSVAEKQEVGIAYGEIPKKKLTTIGYICDIRMAYVPSDGNKSGAYNKIKEMAGTFNQFQWPYVNGVYLKRRGIDKELKRRFRERDCYENMLLGIDEIATMWHLPMWNLETPNIVWVRSKKLEPPSDLPWPADCRDLTLLGKTNFRGDHREFGIKIPDRARHVYIIGKTGMGKSTVLENMVYDDIMKGRGVAAIDPHGDLADKMVAFIPEERIKDVIVFDPSDREFPVSFNMLECHKPEQRTLVASGLVGVFKKMYSDSWGPRLEHILRNTILALTEYPGATIMGILRMLSDAAYRQKVVDCVQDPVVKAFWSEEFAGYSEKQRTEAIAPIQNKVGQFLSSPIIRNILGQVKSSIHLREVMDSKKILIVNLSKGKIGEDNSALLGAMLVTKFQLEAMSRADIEENVRVPFYLYVDEFQNFATDSFATILSEARKYKLNLTMANQYVAQMDEIVTEAVFGNVGTLITFQAGYDDAEYFSRQFAEEVSANDIISLSKFTTYMRLLNDNMPTKTFSAIMNPPVEVKVDEERVRRIIDFSRTRYGAPLALVESSIQKQSAPKVGRELKAGNQRVIGGGVRWRYDRNRYEFQEIIQSAGKKCRELNREEFDTYGIIDAVNEYVYFLPEEKVIVYSRIDTQGNCFNRKKNCDILLVRWNEDDSTQNEQIGKVEKGPGWQIDVSKYLGGGFRHSQNQVEMEEVFDRLQLEWEVVRRGDFRKYEIEKAVNELVYLLNEQYVLLSALDSQGGCFTKNPEQVLRLYRSEAGQLNQIDSMKKSDKWMVDLQKMLEDQFEGS